MDNFLWGIPTKEAHRLQRYCPIAPPEQSVEVVHVVGHEVQSTGKPMPDWYWFPEQWS